MKKIHSNILLVLLLVAMSFGIYLFQVTQFNSLKNTTFYFLQDLAFLPFQVAIVTIALKRIISAQEKRIRLKKMNMVISSFFGEAGTDIILKLIQFNPMVENLHSQLEITGEWGSRDFQKAVKLVKGYDFAIDSKAGNLVALKDLLLEKRYFLLSMLQNPNLLEHETFTDMLWAVFHLTDELVARDSFSDLPDTDLDHLSIDIKRALQRTTC